MSFFESLLPLPEDPIFGVQVAFLNDPNQKKVNLGIGAYRDAEGNPLVFTAVRKAEQLLLKKNLNKEYLPITGDKIFVEETAKLIFGKENSRWLDGSIFGTQTVGGTSALRVGAELFEGKTVYLPNMTWANHKQIFSRAGLQVKEYPYYDFKSHTFTFSEMSAAIKNMPPNSILVLHGTSHNPTGANPSLDQWKEIARMTTEAHVIPFLDLAYQGFGLGMEEDAQPLRYFTSQNHDLLVSYTYAKNMGLYGERTGAFFVCTKNKDEAQKLGTHIKQIIRSMYSNPPLHGARIATAILQSEELKKEWLNELTSIRERVADMRTSLTDKLLSKSNSNCFSFLNEGKTGLFAFTGISSDQVMHLRNAYAIYLPDGRVNLAGLNSSNIEYVTDALVSL